MGHDGYSLSDLAPGADCAKKAALAECEKTAYLAECKKALAASGGGRGGGAGYFLCRGFGVYLLWFLILSLVAWVILFSLQPSFIMKNNPSTGLNQLDTGKLLLYSVIIGLIVTLIIWLLTSCWGW